MQIIQEIHESILSHLLEWSEKARAENGLNPYFYLRSIRDARLRQGYWFPGNDDYLCISFWKGGDAFNKTPNISLDINLKKGITIILVSKDSPLKLEFLDGLVQELDKNSANKFQKFLKRRVKFLENNAANYLEVIDRFLENEKPIIDKYILKNRDELILEEFIQPIDFIPPVDFEGMLSKVNRERQPLLRDKKIDAILAPEPNANSLPLALRSITIENYQGINKASIEDLPGDAQWIFITGENGYGKTSLLQSIALCLSDSPELEKYLGEKTRISAELVHTNESDYLTRIKGNLSQIGSLDYGRYAVGYGPSRLNVQAETSQNEESKSDNTLLGLFDSTTLLKSLSYELFASETRDRDVFDSLTQIIQEVTQGRIRKIYIHNREVLFQEVINGTDELMPLPLDRLAAGFRNVINVVGDLFIRFSKAHGHKRYKDFWGLALIDEIENHLHPVIQKDLASNLSQVFPNIQFIATTHSPIPLLSTPEKRTVILTVNRSLNQGVEFQRLPKLEKEIQTLSPDTILTSSIFSFDYLERLSEKQFENLTTVDVYKDIEKYKRLNSELSDLSKDIFPDSLFDEE